MLDLRNNFSLYYDFYMVVLYGGFSSAAKELYISQSTLSRNVLKLEEQYNCELILRLQNGIQLTKVGEQVYKSLKEMFKLFDGKDLKIHDTIIIGTTRNIADYFLENIIVEFYRKNPNIQLSVKTTDSKTLKKLLLNREIDIMIDYLPFDVDNSDLNIKIVPLGEYQTCFACTKKYYNENKKNLKDLKNIIKHKIIAPGTSRRRQTLDQYLLQNNVQIEPIIEVHNSKLLLDLVRLNDGIGYFIYDEISDKLDEFEIIGNINNYPRNPIGAIYFNKFISTNLSKFIKCLNEETQKYITNKQKEEIL